MGITGTLECLDRKANGWELTERQEAAAGGSKKHERWPAIFMLIFFLAGVIAMIVAGFSVGT
jgi:hypothetical protein